nr:MAG TPA: hypothetical protein [Caudoviricetes sp.]
MLNGDLATKTSHCVLNEPGKEARRQKIKYCLTVLVGRKSEESK